MSVISCPSSRTLVCISLNRACCSSYRWLDPDFNRSAMSGGIKNDARSVPICRYNRIIVKAPSFKNKVENNAFVFFAVFGCYGYYFAFLMLFGALRKKNIGAIFVISVHIFFFVGWWLATPLPLLCYFYKIGFFETTPLTFFCIVVHLASVVCLLLALCLGDKFRFECTVSLS